MSLITCCDKKQYEENVFNCDRVCCIAAEKLLFVVYQLVITQCGRRQVAVGSVHLLRCSLPHILLFCVWKSDLCFLP